MNRRTLFHRTDDKKNLKLDDLSNFGPKELTDTLTVKMGKGTRTTERACDCTPRDGLETPTFPSARLGPRPARPLWAPTPAPHACSTRHAVLRDGLFLGLEVWQLDEEVWQLDAVPVVFPMHPIAIARKTLRIAVLWGNFG